jgi:hypothetical protein
MKIDNLLWFALVCFGLLWFALVCFGLLWFALFIEINRLYFF